MRIGGGGGRDGYVKVSIIWGMRNAKDLVRMKVYLGKRGFEGLRG